MVECREVDDVSNVAPDPSMRRWCAASFSQYRNET